MGVKIVMIMAGCGFIISLQDVLGLLNLKSKISNNQSKIWVPELVELKKSMEKSPT